jgi:LCP family protein required for cell wall assembly
MKRVKILITLIILLMLGIVSTMVYMFLNSNLGLKPEAPVSGLDKVEPSAKRFNILMIGVDKVGMNTDTIMLANIDTLNGTVNLVSIPRDTLIFYNGNRQKINACYALDKGKIDLLIKNVKDITGASINYYAKIDYLGFRKVIDILGGVEIDVQRNMDYEDPGQNLKIHIKKGKQVLDGFKAEGYVRFRHTYTNGDLGRIEVQKGFIKELLRQKLQPKYITKAPELINQIYKNVETNLLVKDALGMLPSIDKFKADNCFNSFTLPGEAENIQSLSYFIADETAAAELLKEPFSTKIVKKSSSSSLASSSKSSK